MPEAPLSKSDDAPHVAALDGLRFFAFVGVYASHSGGGSVLRVLAEYGALGVQVFFVLSGFLIGSILYDLRGRNDATLSRKLWTFYVRRGLRIFPLYYVALAVLAPLPVLGSPYFGQISDWPWHLAYLSNVRMALTGRELGGMSHLWSLSVEEHFYLVAPLLVLTLSIRTLSICFVGIWGACMLSRAWLGPSYVQLSVLSNFQFDCLTIGIAAAILHAEGTFLGVSRRMATRITGVSAIVAVLLLAARQVPDPSFEFVSRTFSQWFFAVASAGAVVHLWTSKNSVAVRIASYRPFTYLGKISYGLYVWHFPVLLLTSDSLSGMLSGGKSLPAFVLTVLLAMATWHAFERPLTRLKKHFPYVARSPLQRAAP